MTTHSQRSLSLLSAIVEASGDAIVSCDPQQRFTTWNTAAERLFGYSAGEVIGQGLSLIVPPNGESECAAVLAQLATTTGPLSLETKRRRKDGSLIDVEMKASAFCDPDGEILGFVSIIRDITERKAAEATLAATHQQTREVLERITDGFLAVDRAWRFTYINEAAEMVLGRRRDELLGKNAWEMFAPAAETSVLAATHQAMTDGVTTSFELFYPPLNGWFEGRVYPSPGGLSIFFRDATSQKRAEATMTEAVAELQATNRQLETVSAAKSEFVSMISHEFRTPLTSIQGFSELIASEGLSLDEVHEFASTINESARRLARMIGDVLDLDRLEAGQTTLRPRQVILNDIVERVVASLRPTTDIHLFELELAPTLPTIRGDADLLDRLITNLVANAIKYSPAGGMIRVRTAGTATGVELSVADQGLGIPPEYLDIIFSRYGRIARPEQQEIEGTGLGLPISHSIVKLHRGAIWVESTAAVGSIFHVELPWDGPVT